MAKEIIEAFCPVCGGEMSEKDTKHRKFQKKFKKEVLKRDGNRCIYCFSSKFLEAAHIISLKRGLKQGYTLKQLYNSNNGVTLCDNCHLLYDWTINPSPHKYSGSYLPGRKKYNARFIKRAVENYAKLKLRRLEDV